MDFQNSKFVGTMIGMSLHVNDYFNYVVALRFLRYLALENKVRIVIISRKCKNFYTFIHNLLIYSLIWIQVDIVTGMTIIAVEHF